MAWWATPGAADRTWVPDRLRGYLADGEKVVRAQRDHPACLSLPMLLLFGGLLLASSASQRTSADGAKFLWFAWLILFGWACYRCWDWYRRWFIVTDKRIIRASGTFRIRIAQLMIALGRDITVEQNLLGEWLQYGTFKVESAREDHPMRKVAWLAEPDKLYKAISATVQGGSGGGAGGAAVATVIGGDGEGGGGVLVVDESTRNPTQRIQPVQPPPRRRDRMGLIASRALDRIAPVPSATPRPGGQNANPGIIASSRPAAHARDRAIQDYGYSDAAPRRPLGGLGRVKDLGLFRRRG